MLLDHQVACVHDVLYFPNFRSFLRIFRKTPDYVICPHTDRPITCFKDGGKTLQDILHNHEAVFLRKSSFFLILYKLLQSLIIFLDVMSRKSIVLLFLDDLHNILSRKFELIAENALIVFQSFPEFYILDRCSVVNLHKVVV